MCFSFLPSSCSHQEVQAQVVEIASSIIDDLREGVDEQLADDKDIHVGTSEQCYGEVCTRVFCLLNRVLYLY